MAEPEKQWAPDPESWTWEQYEKASALVAADQWQDDGKRQKMRAAVDWYDRNMANEPAGDAPEPLPDFGNLGGGAPAPAPMQVTRPAKVVTVTDAKRPEKSALEMLAEGMGQAAEPLQRAGRTALDGARGWGQGATFGAGEEGAAKLVPEVDDGTGISRTYAAGSADADMRASMRRDNDEARERSPIAYGGAELAAMIPAAVATSPALPGAAPLAARAALRAATTGGQAMLSHLGHANADGASPETVEDSAATARNAIGIDGAMQLLASGAGAAGRAAAPALGRGASYLRGKATGIMPAEARQVLANEGVDGISDMGAFVEQKSLHLNKHGFPTSAKGIHENASRLADESGARIGDLTEWMSDVEGVAKPTRSVFASARSALSKLKGDARLPEEQAAARAALDDLAQTEAAYGGQEMMSVADIHDLKRRVQKRVYESTKAQRVSPSPDPVVTHRGTADRNLDANVRGQMYDLVDDPEARWGGASAESAAEFRGAMDEHGAARAVEKAAEKRAGHQAGYVPLGLTAMLGGTAAGASAYGTDQDAKGTAGATALGALAAVAGNRYGANYGATGARVMQRGADAVGRAAQPIARAMPVGNAAGAMSRDDKPLPPESIDVLEEIETTPDAYGEQTDLIAQIAREGDVKKLRLALMAAAQRRN